MVKLHDLVSDVESRYFSPGCVRARLALLTKGVPFETVEVTYHDLRFTWTGSAELGGVERATAPFIQRDDGTYLMDSVEIALWLDKTFPDRQNLFLPEAPLPVDVESEEYKTAVERYKESEEPGFSSTSLEAILAAELRRDNFPAAKLIFALYAPRIVQLFDEETKAYWTSDGRLGKGVFARLSQQTPVDDIKTVEQLVASLTELASKELPNGHLFLSSATKPGLKDFSIYGSYRLIRSVSAKLAAETFGAVPAWAAWLERIKELYPVEVFDERDPKE